jgi:hypothetical protein
MNPLLLKEFLNLGCRVEFSRSMDDKCTRASPPPWNVSIWCLKL